jgi:hypothetical protein
VAQVTGEGILTHLRALETIANRPENEGSRAVFLGYNASVEYVVTTLTANTNYDIVIQTLPVSLPIYVTPPVLRAEGPVLATFALNTDFLGYNYGASGNVVARPQLVRGGCNIADYDDFMPGRVAIVNRGAYAPPGVNITTCSYRVKVCVYVPP